MLNISPQLCLLLTVNAVIAFTAILYLPYLFTLSIILYVLILFLIMYKVKTPNRFSALLGVLTSCLWIRIFPYIDGIPLGVDPIRDIIYSYNVIQKASLVYNMPYFVKYYEYFPATQLLPLINAIISGADVSYAHYLALSALSSLGVIPLILVLRNLNNAFRRWSGLTILAGLLYAIIPTIATWGYWVIPMTFSVLMALFSLMLFTTYLKNHRPELIVLSLIFSMLSVMVHAVVGTLVLGFYVMYAIILYLNIRGRRKTEKHMLKISTIYSIVLSTYTILYWNLIGFMQYFIRYVNSSYLRAVKILSKPLRLTVHGTRSIILPVSPKITVIPPYPQVIEYMPKEYPIMYIAPRWFWSFLLIALPLLLLIIVKKGKVKIHTFVLTSGIYSLLVLVFTVFSIYFNIIWKADRYLASPITPYAIIFIVASFYMLAKYKMNVKMKNFIALMILTLIAASVLDPRVSFYTNPVEGDRVTFKPSEKIASKFLLSTLGTGYVISDYNLMTSYLYYLTIRSGLANVEILFRPLRYCLREKTWSKDWVFLFRKYSVESYYIWSLNYAGKPQVINEVFYRTNLVYDCGECFIFKSIAVEK
ncbi:MAG: hypothetical protein DRO23_11560 [Thermoprotei archaeon]|nr:MAG: hypothetical protein DRO23_11560 [Thermoprotei archaeon]